MSKTISSLTEKYVPSLRWLHWSMMMCFVLIFALGMVMVDLDKDDEVRPVLFWLHKSFGVLSLLLLALRLVIRLLFPVPATVATGSVLQKVLTNWVHKLLYALMLCIPIIGWAHSDLHGRGVKLFGLELPKVFPTIEGIGLWPGEIHGYLAYAFLCLVVVHIAGVIKQHYVYGNKVLQRMV